MATIVAAAPKVNPILSTLVSIRGNRDVTGRVLSFLESHELASLECVNTVWRNAARECLAWRSQAYIQSMIPEAPPAEGIGSEMFYR